MNRYVGNEPSFDPSQLTMKEKVEFFEKNWEGHPRMFSEAPEEMPNIVARSMKALNLTGSKKFVLKKPASIHETSFQPKSSASATRIYANKTNIPMPKSLEMNDSFKESQQMSVPEILEVFTDLDLFIENELSDITTKKRVEKLVEGQVATPDRASVVDEILKMKEEFLKDKQMYQKELERQMKHESKFQAIQEVEEEEGGESSDPEAEDVQMNRRRLRKIESLKLEASRQELLLTKINRILERIRVTDDNLASVVTIERHYLVCSNRLQSAMCELQRLRDIREPLYQNSFDKSGKCVISDIMLEVKAEYFARKEKLRNEFLVVMLKYGEDVYASSVVCINDDVRVVKFPNKFRVPDAFVDFEMRLEIYGTTFWRKRNLIRETMLKKYGYFTFTLADTGTKRKRLEMVEVITSQSNPLRKKVLMKIRQKITADVHYDGTLRVMLGRTWYKAQAVLIGHLLEIALADDVEDSTRPSILLDLHKFDSDFIIPLATRDYPPYTFLLRFNEYVYGTEFHLLVAAETAEDYENWVTLINKALVLIRE